jgi:hypothetical protein
MSTPLLVESTDYGDDLGVLVADPAIEVIPIISVSVPTPTLEDGWPTADFADAQVEADGVWGSFKVVFDGKDVTGFRGGVTIDDYQLTEPYGYGPANFTLPISALEVDQWGSGDLAWFNNEKAAKIVQVDAGGERVRTIWEGFVTLPNPSLASTDVQCDGLASGRLSARIKWPDLFRREQHVGRKVYDAFRYCGLRLTPFLGADIGVLMSGRGLTGTYLGYVDSLLAATTEVDGSQYTVMPTSGAAWLLAPKDTTTVDFTVHLGAFGVEVDIQDDITERPNSYYGQGISPENLIWVNGKYPALIQGETPPYPMDDNSSFGAGTTDADTDTGDGITILIHKLVGTGYLPRTKVPGGYDVDITRAVKALQDDAGLTKTGDVNPDTWDALYDVTVTRYTTGAFMAPLAQDTRVRKWNRTSNGSPKALNPNFDPTIVPRDFYQDYGANIEQSDARANARGMLQRSQNGKNWNGTITLTSDVWAGEHAHADEGTPMSRLDIEAGMNVMLRNFDGDTLFHIASVFVTAGDQGPIVQLGVDTQARDAATLAEIMERRIESRERPARQWLRQHQTGAMVHSVQGTVDFGQVFNTVDLPGGEWTVLRVLAGDAGSVSRIRIQTTGDKAVFVVAITAIKTTDTYWNNKVPNPLLGGQVTSVFVNNSGSGYSSAPSVSLTGGGGSGATARAVISGGKLIAVELKNHGTGYTANPSVSITGGGGSGATATASIDIGDLWTASKMLKLVDDQRALLGAWGDPNQPCGYSPGRYSNSLNVPTGAPITGLFTEDAGFDYHTFARPFLYVAVFPDRDCQIRPQRILWETVENDT